LTFGVIEAEVGVGGVMQYEFGVKVEKKKRNQSLKSPLVAAYEGEI